MNNNKRVLALILSVTCILLMLSFFSNAIVVYFPNFKNINLISDILKKKEDSKITNPKAVISSENPKDSSCYTFEDYIKKETIVKFEADTLKPSLQKLSEKLLLLSQHKKVKIRIAWFGDSQIEGDFITQDLRKLLQNYFGANNGVGFVPVASISSDFRKTATLEVNGAVKIDNFKKTNGHTNLFLSGYSFYGNNLSINFKDNTQKNSSQITEKWLLYGKGDSIAIKNNDTIYKKYPANSYFNRVLLNKSSLNNAKFALASGNTPIYGVSSEPESGIVLDNFSFRGITGVELKKLNVNLLDQLNKSGYYDLIVFQYGVNLMFRPNDTNYDYYYKVMNPVLKKMKDHMGNSEFLLLSCSDRAFNYNGEWKTAIGLDSLIYTQARLAHENKIPYYNFYKSMGGNGTMVKWADSTSALANKDYVHFNFRGAKIAANIIFKAIINDYQKAERKVKFSKKTVSISSKKNTQQ
ncbi:MAG: hypothetical protein ABI426_08445 [Flavobacterium sp.]